MSSQTSEGPPLAGFPQAAGGGGDLMLTASFV